MSHVRLQFGSGQGNSPFSQRPTPTPIGDPSRAFQSFVHRVAPAPAPERIPYYVENFSANVYDSWKTGGIRYRSDLEKSSRTRWFHTGFGIAFGLILTALNTNQGWLKAVGLGILGIPPIFKIVREITELGESFDQVEAGNPKKARSEFKESLDNLMTVTHHFLRPLLTAGSIAFLLTIPKYVRPDPKNLGFFAKLIRRGMQSVGLSSERLPLKPINWVTKNLEHWGEKIYSRLSNMAQPTLDKIGKRLRLQWLANWLKK